MDRHSYKASLPPLIRAQANGDPVGFENLCSEASMKNNITVSQPPDIRLHRLGFDFVAVPCPGKRIYCVDVTGLPENASERARVILEKLAYGFRVWEAREVLRHAHTIQLESDQENTPENVLRRALAPNAVRIADFIKHQRPKSVSELAEMVGMKQSNVSRTLRVLERAGAISMERCGRGRRPVFNKHPIECGAHSRLLGEASRTDGLEDRDSDDNPSY